jgi:integrase/recombinase XerD
MTKRVSPLRQRMIDDMTIRNMSANTQEVYIRAVVGLSALHGRSPDKLTLEDVRDYQLHLVARGLKPASINMYMSGLRFFYAATLGQRYLACQIPMARTQDPLPTVLSPGEVERFLKAVKTMKMRAAFMTIYGAGLRVSELAALTVSDIDSARMVINVRQAKGGKDRHIMLSSQLLSILRDYWRQTRPSHWLFPGADPLSPITKRRLQLAFHEALKAAGIRKPATVHTLRHSFATHLLEQRVDIRVIQDLLGHRDIRSTTRYTRVAVETIRQVQSPLDFLNMRLAPPA